MQINFWSYWIRLFTNLDENLIFYIIIYCEFFELDHDHHLRKRSD